MRVVYATITLVSFLAILLGLLGARQNLLMTASAFESIANRQSADESDEAALHDGSLTAGPVTEKQYITGMSTVLQSLGDNTLIAYQLNAQAADDPALLADKLWQEQIEQTTIRFRSAGEIVRQAAVPVTCAPSHEQIRSAVDHYDRCIELYAAAIDGGNNAIIEQCNGELQAGYLDVRLAEELLADLQANGADAGPGGELDPSADSFSAISGSAAIVKTDANLRNGPGVDHEIVGGRLRGDMVFPVAANEAGDWVQLDSGAWIAGWLLDETPTGLPVAQ